MACPLNSILLSLVFHFLFLFLFLCCSPRPFKIQSNDNVQNTLRIIFISRNIKTKVWEIVQIARAIDILIEI